MITPQELTLFDSYQKKLITINPALTVEPGMIKFYSCGPTVYNYQHIGNLRATWFADTINLAAKINGWETKWVMNITDVGHLVGDGDDGQNVSTSEDKIEKAAIGEGKTVEEIVSHYTNDFIQQGKAINLEIPTGINRPKATEYIEEQMILALNLLSKGKAYLLTDGIYFDSEANDHSLFKTENAGDNAYTGRSIKNTTKNPSDFALWKFVEENTLQKWKFNQFDATAEYMLKIIQANQTEEFMALPNKWGTPGWHSECVAMICKIMNGSFPPVTQGKDIIDVHLGGEDHIDIHHKNEILQSKATGFNLSTFWAHNKFVLIDSAKMSKSKGNVYRIVADDEIGITSRGYDPLAYRMMLMEHHYTEQLNFTWDKLTQSQNRLYNLRKDVAQIISFARTNSIEPLETINESQKQVLAKILAENLNTPLFLEKFQDLIKDTINKILGSGELNPNNLTAILYWDKEFLKLNLTPSIPESVLESIQTRIAAKQAKDYQTADEIRNILTTDGYQLEDYPWGSGVWVK